MKKNRFIYLDFLKGIAIVAVVLYHFGGGYLPYGYLGVDIFFVVSGFLLIKQLCQQFQKNSFIYLDFLLKKIVRLWPLILLAALSSLIAGYHLMLPDSFENLAESALASSLFLENILECITTKNYWDIVNLYKPLMHLWYIGVLMQVYILLPLVFIITTRVFKNTRKTIFITTIAVTGISLMLYIAPVFTSAWKFYLLPFRLFEVTAGGLAVFYENGLNIVKKKIVQWISFAVILFLLSSRWEILSSGIMLVLTVLFTLVFVICSIQDIQSDNYSLVISVIAEIGKASYSIYIWHQVLIALLFYSVFPQQSINSLAIVIVSTAAISSISYKYIEQPLVMVSRNPRTEKKILVGASLLALIVIIPSIVIYAHAGVVRDVPELNINKNNAHQNMHGEYCDRPYLWMREFDDNNKIKILVIGNSFGRDWANILYEYDKTDSFQISYIYFANTYTDKDLIPYQKRIEQADYVFVAKVKSIYSITVIPADKFYLVSNKNYGTSNGIIYAHRFDPDYYNQTITVQQLLLEENRLDAEKYGTHFIDLMKPIMIDMTHARVFTDDNKFISQDCRHLTQAGAEYYARILNLGGLFQTR